MSTPANPITTMDPLLREPADHDGPCAAEPTAETAARFDQVEAQRRAAEEVTPWVPPVFKPLDLPHGIQGAVNDVFSFHDAMAVPVLDDPQWPGQARADLRWSLIREEFIELANALGVALPDELDCRGPECTTSALDRRGGVTDPREQICLVADGIVDLIYVLVGTALEFGIPLERVWREVQKANMAKVGGPVREDGKRLKPEGWQPPNIVDAVFGGAYVDPSFKG